MQVELELDKIIYQPLTYQYLEGTTRVVYNSFVNKNQIWKQVPSSYKEMHDIIYNRLRITIPTETTFIATINDTVISCFSVASMKEFKKLAKEESKTAHNSQLFKILSKYQGDIIKSFDKIENDHEWIFAMYGAVEEPFRKTQILLELYLRLQGVIIQKKYKYICGFATDPRSTELFLPYIKSNLTLELKNEEITGLNGLKINYMTYDISKVYKRPSL